MCVCVYGCMGVWVYLCQAELSVGISAVCCCRDVLPPSCLWLCLSSQLSVALPVPFYSKLRPHYAQTDTHGMLQKHLLTGELPSWHAYCGHYSVPFKLLEAQSLIDLYIVNEIVC